METSAQPRAWKVLLAFVIIYFVWGATFLAIRVGGARGSAISFGGNALPGCGNRALWLDARPGHTLSERARVGRGVVSCGPDFCFRLRTTLLGGASSAVGHRGGHDG